MKLRSTLLFAAASFAASALVPVVTTSSAAFFAAAALSVPAQAATGSELSTSGGTFTDDLSGYASYTTNTAAYSGVGAGYYVGNSGVTGDLIIGSTSSSMDGSSTGIAITDANSGTQTISGSVSGDGVFAVFYGSTAGTTFNFTGDLSGFSGTFFTNAHTNYSGRYFTFTFSGTGTGAVAGTGTIISDYTVNFAVESGDVTVANSSITALNLNFSGADYTVTGDVTGTGSGALTISSGSVDFQGSVSGFSTITVTGDIALNGSGTLDLSGATVSISGGLTVGYAMDIDLSAASSVTLDLTDVTIAGTVDVSGLTVSVSGDFEVSGTLDLSGATVSLGSTIENSGLITVDEDTVFDLSSDISSDGSTYVVISGGTIVGWDSLSLSSFMVDGTELSGRSSITLTSAGTVVINLSGGEYVTWNGTSASSVWDAETTSNWITNSGDTDVFYNQDDVVFDSTAESKTVTVESAVSAGTVTVDDDYTFNISSGASVTAATLTGTGSLAIEGEGTFTATTISVEDDETLTIASGTITAGTLETTGTLEISESATLAFTTATDGFSAENISGAGTVEVALTTTWANAVVIGGGTSFTGTTYVTSGYLTLNTSTFGSTLELADGVSAQITAATTVSADLVLDGTSQVHLNSSNALTLNGSLTGDGTLEKRGRGTLTVTGTVDIGGYTQTTAGSGTTVISGAGASIDTVTLSVGTLTISGDDATIGTLTNSGNAFTISGSGANIGTATLSGGTNTISDSDATIGTLTLSGGTTTLSGDGAAITTLTVSGGTLTISGSGTTIGTATLSGGTNTISGDTTITALTVDSGLELTVSAGTLTVDVTSLSLSGTIALDDDAALDLGSASSSSYSVSVTGAGTVYFTSTNEAYSSGVKLGSDFTGDFYYSGNYNPNQSSAGSGTLHLSDGTMWVGSGSISNTVIFETDYTIGSSSSSTVSFTGSVSAADGTTLSVGTGNGSTTVTFSGDIDLDALTIGSNGTVTVTGTALFGEVSNSGTLDLSSATVTISETITNTGTVTVSESTIFALVSSMAVDDTYTVISSDGTISGWSSLTYLNFTVDGVELSSRSTVTVDEDGVVTIVAVASATALWTGAESDLWDDSAENWTDEDGAVFTFATGDNVTFDDTSDETTVTVSGAISAGTVKVNADYTFNIDSDASVTATVLTGTGSITVEGDGTWTATTISAEDGATLTLVSGTFSAGTLAVEGTLDIGSAATLTGGAIVRQGDGTLNIAGTLTADSFTQSAGTTAVSGAVTLGTLTVSGGTFTLTGDGASITTATLSGGTTTITGTGTTVETLTVSGGTATIADAELSLTTATVSSGTLTFEAADGETTAYTADTLTISGDGAVVLGGGTEFSIDVASLTISDTGTLDVESGATLDLGSAGSGTYYSLNVTGEGTVYFESTNSAYNSGVILSSDFTGDFYYTGNYNPYQSSAGTGTLHLSAGDYGTMWVSSSNAQTLAYNVVFETVYTIGSDAGVTFNGDVTAVNDTLTIGSGAVVAFNGTTTIDDLADNGSTMTVGGDMTVRNFSTSSSTTLTVSDGASLTLTGEGNFASITFTVEGTFVLAENATLILTGTTAEIYNLELYGGTLYYDDETSVTLTGGSLIVGANANVDFFNIVGTIDAISDTLSVETSVDLSQYSLQTADVATLSVGSGATLTLSGAAVTVSGDGATVAVAGTLDLTGAATYTSDVTATGTGTVVVDDTTTIGLTDGLLETDSENVCLVFADTLTVEGWSDLTTDNFTVDGEVVAGRSVISTTDYSITVNPAADLIWAGTDGNSTWVQNATSQDEADLTKNWTYDGEADAFYKYDNVTFDDTADVKDVTVSGEIVAGTVTVSDDYTLTFEDGASLTAASLEVSAGDVTIAGATTTETADDGTTEETVADFSVTADAVTIAEGATLTIESGTLYTTVSGLDLTGTLTVGEDATLDFGDVTDAISSSALTISNVAGTGTIILVGGSDNTALTLSDFSGDVYWTGSIRANSSFGDGAVLHLSQDSDGNGSVFGRALTLAADVVFETDYAVGTTGYGGVTFSGSVSSAEGTTLTLGGSSSYGTEVQFTGDVDLDTVVINSYGEVSFEGTTVIDTLTNASSSTYAASGVLSVTGVAFSGDTTIGVFTNTGTATFSGATTIESVTNTGTLTIDGEGAVITSLTDDGGTTTISGAEAIIGTLTNTGGTVTLSGAGTTVDSMILTGGTTTIEADTTVGILAVAEEQTLTVASGVTLTATGRGSLAGATLDAAEGTLVIDIGETVFNLADATAEVYDFEILSGEISYNSATSITLTGGRLVFGDGVTTGFLAATTIGTITEELIVGADVDADLSQTSLQAVAVSTLSVGSGSTLTLSGATVTVSSDDEDTAATITVEGTLDLTGTTYAVEVAATGTGTIIVDGTTTVVLTDSLLTDTENVYLVFSAGLTVEGWGDVLTTDNIALTVGDETVSISGRSVLAADDNGYTVTVNEAADLIWNGTEDNSTWVQNLTSQDDADLTKDWLNDGSDDAFYKNDNVTFDGTAANKAVTVSGTIIAGTVTVSDDYAFTFEEGATLSTTGLTVSAGTSSFAGEDTAYSITADAVTIAEGATLTLGDAGTLTVDAANLSVEGTLTIDAGATLDLGAGTGTYTLSGVDGTGTIYFESTDDGFDTGVDLSGFNGSLYYTGNYNTAYSSLDSDGTLYLSAGTTTDADGNTVSTGALWVESGAGVQTLNYNIVFETNYTLGGSTAAAFEIVGDVSAEDGTTISIGTGDGATAVSITGDSVEFDTLTIGAEGVLTVSDATVTITTLTNNSTTTYSLSEDVFFTGVSFGGDTTITTFTNTGTAEFGGDATVTTFTNTGGTVTAAGSTTITTFTNTGTSTFSGEDATVKITTLTNTGGSVSVAGKANITTYASSAGTLTLSGGGSVTTITLSGSGDSLTFSGDEGTTYTVGTISTASSGSYTRTITIDEGVTVSATSFTNAWGIGTLTVDGTFEVGAIQFSTGSNASTTTNVITGTGTISVTTITVGNVGTYNIDGGIRLEIGSGGIVPTSNNSTSMVVNLGDATIASADDDWSSGVALTLTDSDTGTTFDAADGTTIALSGVLSGSGALVKTGAGTLSLSGVNTYTGGTTVSEGTLEATVTGALGTGGVTVGSDGTLSIAISGGGTLTLSGTIVVEGTLSVDEGTLAIASGATADLSTATVSLTSAIENAGTVTVSSGTTFDLSSEMISRSTDGEVYVISGSGLILGWDDLEAYANFTIDGEEIDTTHTTLTVSDTTLGLVTLTFTDLVWNGTGTSDYTWSTDKTVTNWLNSSDAADYFVANDSVTFTSDAYQTVRIASDIVAGTATVASGTYTFNILSAGSLTVSSLAVEDDASLTIKGAGTFEATAVSVGSGATLDLSQATVTLGSAIENEGTVVVSSSSYFYLSSDLLAEDSDSTYVLVSGGTIEGWDALSADNFTFTEAMSIVAEIDVSTAGTVSVGYYSGTVLTWTYNTGDMAYGAWYETTTNSSGEYVLGTGHTTWSGDVNALIATTSTTTDYNTLRFVSGTSSPTSFTFTPLAIAGVIVEEGATGFTITPGSTSYGRVIYLGNGTDTEAYSTINEDFTISNASSTSTGTAFYIQGTQTWTIADGVTFTLATPDTGLGFIISGDLTITGGGTADFVGSSSGTTIASTADITISGATVDWTDSTFTATAGTVTIDDSGTLDLSGATVDIYGLALLSGEIAYDEDTTITFGGGQFSLGSDADTSVLEIIYPIETVTEELSIGDDVEIDMTDYGLTTVDVETLAVGSDATLGLAGTDVAVSGTLTVESGGTLDLTGANVSIAGTLSGSGTINLTDASVTISGDITIAEGSTLDLSGATYTASVTAEAAGTIVVDSSTTFVLTDGVAEEEGSNVYVLFSGDGLTIEGWSDLTTDNFELDGSPISGRSSVSDDYIVTVAYSLDIVWNGTESSSTWVMNTGNDDESDLVKNWLYTDSEGAETDEAFYRRDNVTFAALEDGSDVTSDVTISGSIYTGTLTVEGDYTFTFEDGAYLTTTDTLTIANGVTLTLEGAGTLAVDVSNLSIAAEVIDEDDITTAEAGALKVNGDAVLDLGEISATYTNANIYGDGSINVVDSTDSYSVGIRLANFEGDVYFTGSINPVNVTLNSEATLHLSSASSDSDSSMWVGAANAQTLDYNVVFETNYTLGGSTASAFTFTGDVSGAEGIAVSVGVGTGTTTVAFEGGALDFDGLTIGDTGVVSVYGGGTLNIGTVLTNTGTLTLGNVTVTTAGTINGDIELSNTLDEDYTGTTFEIASGNTATISGSVSGEGTLVKTGDGSLVISGENTYSVDTTVSAGTLEFNGTDEISAATITVADGATVSFTTATSGTADETSVKDVTFAAADGGSLTLYAGEYETVTFESGVTLPDEVTFSGEGSGSSRGTFNFASDNSIASLTLDGAGLTVESLYVLSITDGLTFTGSTTGSVSGNGTLALAGTVTADESRANITIAELDFSGSSVEFTGSATIYISSATITSDTETVLTKTGSGTLSFSEDSGVASLKGSLVLKEGTISLSDVSLDSLSSLTVAGGTTLTADVTLSGENVSLTLERGATISGTLTIAGTEEAKATAVIGGSDIGGSEVTSASVTSVSVSDTDITFSAALSLSGTLYWGDGNSITLSDSFQNSITETTTLISFSATDMTTDDLDGLLQGVSTYGRRGLVLSLTSTALNVSIGGALLWNNDVSTWETDLWSWVDGDDTSGTTVWYDNDYVMFKDAGSVAVNGDTLFTSGMVFELDGTFTISGDFALASTNYDVNGIIDAGITITSGDIVFAGNVTSTLEGGITITGGSLTVANGGDALGSGDIVLGELSSTTEAALKFSATGSDVTQQIYLANEYVTIEVAEGAEIVIENALARYETEEASAVTGLTKAGDGTLTVQRDSAADTLTVSAGTLILAGDADNAIVAGTAVIAAGATLSIANGSTDGANTEISSITLGGDGATLSVSNGAFRADTIEAAGGTISGSLAVGSTGTTIEVDSETILALSGDISAYEDGAYVALTGAGTLEIGDGNTVATDVVQSAGTLAFAGTASLTGAYSTAENGSATVSTASGGTFEGLVTLGDGSSLTIANGEDATLTLAGGVTADGDADVAISGGTVAVQGDTADFGSTLTLTDTTLDVSAGTLAVDDALTLSSSTLVLAADTEAEIGEIAVDTAATLDLSSGAWLYVNGSTGAALSGSGTLTVVGSTDGDSLAGTLIVDVSGITSVDDLSIALDNAILEVYAETAGVLSVDSVSTVSGSEGAINKIGEGTLYLLSENASASFDGDILLQEGTTIATTRFGSADMTIESDATFAFLGSATTDTTLRTVLASSLSGSGTLAIGGTLTVDGTNGGVLADFTGTLAAAKVVSPITGDTLGVGTIYVNDTLEDWLANASGSSVALLGGAIVSEEDAVEIVPTVTLEDSGTLQALTEDVKLTLSGGISGSGDLSVVGFVEIGDISGSDITIAVSGYAQDVEVTDDDGNVTTESQMVYGELTLSGTTDGLDSLSGTYSKIYIADSAALGDASVSLSYSTLSFDADGSYANDITLASGFVYVTADGATAELTGTFTASRSSVRATFTATNAGTLIVDGSAIGLGITATNFVADADSTVAVTVTDDGTLDADSASISGEGTFEKLGTGTLTIEGEIGSVGTFAVEEGTVIFAESSALAGSDGAGTLSVASGATVELNKGADLSEMTLTGAGSVTVSAGELDTDDAVTVVKLAAIEDATDITIETGTLSVAGDVSGSSIVFSDDGSVLKLTGDNVLVSDTTLSGTTVTIQNASENNGAQTIDSSVTLADDVETLVLYAQRGTTGGVVEAEFVGSIEKTGDGTWTLTNYTLGADATLTVTAGTLIWQNAAFDDDAETLTVAEDGTLRIEGLAGDTGDFTGSIAGAGTIEIAYAGTEDNPLVLDIDVAEGSTWALRITDDSNVQITCAVPGDLLVSGSGTTAEFVIDDDTDMTARLRVSSGATLVKTGEGTLTLAHVTETSGERTQISGSVLDVQEGEVVQTADIVWDETATLNIAADATFTVRIDDEDFLALIADGTVSNSVYTNSAALTGEGTLAIETTIGDGYSLGGAVADFAGTVTIASGATLNLSGSEVFMNASVEIADGATLALTGTKVTDGSGTLSGLSGSGTLTVDATVSSSFAYATYSYDADSNSDFTGVINIFSGTLTFDVEDLEAIGSSVSAVNVGDGSTTVSYGEAKIAGAVSGGFLRVLNETGAVADATDFPSNYNFSENAGVIFAGDSGFEVNGTLGTASTQLYVLEKDSSASGTATLTLVGSGSSVDGSVFIASGATLYVNAEESSVGSSSSAGTISVASSSTTTATGTNSISGDLTLNGTIIIRVTDETIENDVLLDVAGTTEINPNGLSTKASIELDVSDLSTDSDETEFTIVSGYEGTSASLSDVLEVTIAGESATVSRDGNGNIVVVTSSNDYTPSSQLSSLYAVIKDSDSPIWSVLSDYRADHASMEKSLIALSPVSFGSLLEMQSGFASIENDLLRERLEQRRYESAFASDRNTKFKAFANVFGSTSESDGDGTDSANYDLTHYGIMGGFDVKISDNSIIGLSVAADWTDADLANNAGEHEGDGIRLGLYGMSTFENVFVGYGVSAGGMSFDTKRRSGYNNETLRGSTDGNDLNATILVGAGYTLSRDYGIDITPYVGLDIGYATVDGFSESGGSESALHVDDMDSTSLRGKIGATLSWRATERFRIALDLSYAHEFLDTDVDIDAQFSTGTLAGSGFSTTAYLKDENLIKVGPSIDFRISDMWSLSAAYAFETDLDDRTTHSGNIGVRARF